MFIALPVLICCSATLSLSGTYGIIQGVYPNSGSAAAVVPGTLSEPSVATWKFMLVSNFLADVRGICKSRKYGYNSAMCTVS